MMTPLVFDGGGTFRAPGGRYGTPGGGIGGMTITDLSARYPSAPAAASPMSSVARGSLSGSRDALMATLDPTRSAARRNQSSNRINSVYNDRREALRRRYADFPGMASAEETGLEQERANSLAESETSGQESEAAQQRQLLLQMASLENSDRQFDEARRRFDESSALSAARIPPMRLGGQLRRNPGFQGGGSPWSGNGGVNRGNFIPIGGGAGRSRYS